MFYSVLNKLLYCDLFCLQKTCQSANEVRQRADKLMKDGHFDPEAIWSCADNMSRRWQQLMSKSEERRKVVTASYSFFKSAEQVTTGWLLVNCCMGTVDHSTVARSVSWPLNDSKAASELVLIKTQML